VLVPLAASLASNERRGQVLGTVMSGLLLGILLARTAAGLIAGAFGWRALYGIAAVMMLVLVGVLMRALPDDSARPAKSYGSLLRSVFSLVAGYRELRVRSLYGALGFAAFSVFWTTLAFLLTGPPYRYSTTVIGLFGLIGAAGALSASGAGRLADSGHKRSATGALAAAIAVSFGVLWLGRDSLGALIVGIVVLDIGVQGLHVLNQHTIYGLEPEARSRLNGAYMTSYFIGGASGSALASSLYSSHGWAAVCVLGAGIGVLALCVWTFLDRA
jgi:predicted MFS family arabinose efflux permease